MRPTISKALVALLAFCVGCSAYFLAGTRPGRRSTVKEPARQRPAASDALKPLHLWARMEGVEVTYAGKPHPDYAVFSSGHGELFVTLTEPHPARGLS
jgi:hypothetical protein